VAFTLVALLTGCGGKSRSQKELAQCHSIHENAVLFDKVLVGHHPVIDYPERTFTPVSLVTSKLGKPDQVTPQGYIIFTWWRYGNSAYLIADLNRPGHIYIAAKSCDWSRTKKRANAILKNAGG
jgi:DNA-binding CsgD family transcriptional regulator